MSAVVDLYAALDDATLETVASKGVLRRARADLEKAAIERLEENEIVGTVNGATVRLDAGGLAKSRCSCPAPGTCRHRVALVLAVRRRAMGEDTATAASAALATDWPQRLAAFGQAALVKAVGRAQLREAVRLHALAETVTVDVAPLSLKVTLRAPQETVEVRIPAAGDFATIASSLPSRRQSSAHAPAVLAARRHFAIATEELPEDEAADPAPAEFAPDAALLAAIDAAVCEAYTRGFAVASQAIEERLGLLAISVRAEAMPRLSATLKRIAASLEQRRLRSVAHDPAALLAELALAHALVHALGRASDGESRRRLAGALRAEYLAVGDLDLVGLGAELFETGTGARGVTAYFLEPATGRRFSATLARGNANDLTFEPRAAFANETVWGRRLAHLATARFRLAGAHASSTGRLSLAQSTRAGEPVPFAPTRQVLDDWLGAPDVPMADAVHASWRRLAAGLAEHFAPALDAAAPSAVPVVLVPARVSPVAFDDLTQSLSWPLMDASGQWLALALDYDDQGSGLGARRIAALEAAIGTPGAPRPSAIVALARPDGAKLALTPMALWGEQQILLDFPSRAAPAPERSLVAGLVARIRRATDRFAPPPPVDNANRKVIQLAQGAIDALIETAENGNRLTARRAKLAPLARAFALASLQPLAALFARAAECEDERAADAALAAVWGVTTLQGLARHLPTWGPG
jgi:hypothetical protein